MWVAAARVIVLGFFLLFLLSEKERRALSSKLSSKEGKAGKAGKGEKTLLGLFTKRYGTRTAG